MNKGDFVKAVAEKANCTQKDAGIVFDAVIDTINIFKRTKSL